MADLVTLLTWRDDADLAAKSRLRDALVERGALVRDAMPGGRNAGDLVVRLSNASAGTLPDLGLGPIYDAVIASADGALYSAVAESGAPANSAILRTALFSATHDPTPIRIAAFERETIAMPRRIAAIRGWALGTVQLHWGRSIWTHVWEQGFDHIEGLTGTYMRAPCHWGQVDRWFDPEHPDFLIDPGLCHAFCRAAA